MPTEDLCDPEDKTRLAPLSHFHVFAAMLRPKPYDKIARQMVRDTIRSDVGLKAIHGKTFSYDQGIHILNEGSSRGGACGYLFQTILQFELSHHMPANLHIAIKRHQAVLQAQEILPRFPGAGQREDQGKWNPAQIVRSPRKLRTIFSYYSSVAHLWAAAIHIEASIVGRKDIDVPSSEVGLPQFIDKLPLFINTANAFSTLYSALRPKRFLDKSDLIVRDPWLFKIPESMIEKIPLQPCPIDDGILKTIISKRGCF